MSKHLLLSLLILTSLPAWSSEWTEKIKMNGDFRLREEYSKKGNNAERYRPRIKARFGLLGQVSEDVSVTLKVSTGTTGDTIRSSNQTLGDNQAAKAIWLSEAYGNWQALQTTNILFGKMENPQYRVQKSQLIWDADLTPEGLASQWKQDGENDRKYFGNLVTFILSERYDTKATTPDTDQPDPLVLGGQIGMQCNASDIKLTGGLGYLEFTGLKGQALIDKAAGNTTVGTNYKYAYKIAEAFFELNFNANENLPTAFFAHYAQNLDPSDENIAYIAGVKAGKSKEHGDIEFGYNFRRVEKDAVVGSLKDSDFSGGDSDSEGHMAYVKYTLSSASDVALAYMKSEIGLTGTAVDYDRAHLDFSFRF